MESAWCPVYVTHVPLASTTDPFLCQSTTVMTSTATPNAQLQLALEALRTFNANVIHELERERLRIRNQDGPKSPAAASCPTMTSITIPPNNGSEADATSVVSSRISSLNVAKNVESSPCSPTSPSSSSSAAFTACQIPQGPVSSHPDESEHSDGPEESDVWSAPADSESDNTSILPELLRLIISVVLLGTAKYSIPTALALLALVGLAALRQQRLMMGGSEYAAVSTWKEQGWIFFFGNTKEKIWVQGSLPISESEITSELKCPISLSLFVDPVCFKPTGRVYERRHILRHLSMSGASCDPMSRLPASHDDYVPAPLFRTRAHEIAKVLGYALVDQDSL